MLHVIVQEKDGPRRDLQLDKQEIIIGRTPANDIHLPKNNVSKRHAKIVWQNGAWFLVDLKSTNGSYVNGQPVDNHRLEPTDQVIIGDFLLLFDLSNSTAASHGMNQGMNQGGMMGQAPSIPAAPPAPGGFPPAPAQAPAPFGGGFPAAPNNPMNAAPPASPPRNAPPLGGGSALPSMPGPPGPPPLGTGNLPAMPGLPPGPPSAPGSNPFGGGPPPSSPNSPFPGMGATPPPAPSSTPMGGPPLGGLGVRPPAPPPMGGNPLTGGLSGSNLPQAPTPAVSLGNVGTNIVDASTNDIGDHLDNAFEAALDVSPEDVVEEINDADIQEVLADVQEIAEEVNDAQIEEVEAVHIEEVSDAEIQEEQSLEEAAAGFEEPQATASVDIIEEAPLESAAAHATPAESFEQAPSVDTLDADTFDALRRTKGVSTIFVNPDGTVYYEHHGMMGQANFSFDGTEAVQGLHHELLAQEPHATSQSGPYQHTTLSDGSQLISIDTELTGEGSTLIFRPHHESTDLGAWSESGAVSAQQMEVLHQAIQNRSNVLVVAQQPEEVQTFFQALQPQLPQAERLVSLQQAGFPQLQHSHQLNLTLEPGNEQAYTIQHAVRLQPRYLWAANLGQDGWNALLPLLLTHQKGTWLGCTGYDPDHAIQRLEALLASTPGYANPSTTRRQLQHSTDLIVHLQRSNEGMLYVSQLHEFSVEEGQLIPV